MTKSISAFSSNRVIMAGIESDADLAASFAILTSIPGVSTITAFALIIDMPELGTLDAGKAAALAGLAPMTRQSGLWRGRAFIAGGRSTLRQALYMPALVAARFNPDLKAKYVQLKAAGKPSKVAITAIMRKLVVLAKCSPQSPAKMDTKNTLINTDTLVTLLEQDA